MGMLKNMSKRFSSPRASRAATGSPAQTPTVGSPHAGAAPAPAEKLPPIQLDPSTLEPDDGASGTKALKQVASPDAAPAGPPPKKESSSILGKASSVVSSAGAAVGKGLKAASKVPMEAEALMEKNAAKTIQRSYQAKQETVKAAKLVQNKTRDMLKSKQELAKNVVDPKKRKDMIGNLSKGRKGAFNEFGKMMAKLSPDEIGKMASRAFATSARNSVQFYLWAAERVGTGDGAFTAMLQANPRLAVQLVDSIMQPLMFKLREQVGRMMIEDYGPDSEGYDTGSGLIGVCHRIDDGELDEA